MTPTYDTRNLIIKNLVGFLIEDVCIESQKRISLYTKNAEFRMPIKEALRNFAFRFLLILKSSVGIVEFYKKTYCLFRTDYNI